MTYDDFLKTNQWQLFRRAIWEHYQGRCHICGALGCDTHHLSYEYGLFNPRTAILVCRKCHLIWQGQNPDHIPDSNPLKVTCRRIAEIARALGWSKASDCSAREKQVNVLVEKVAIDDSGVPC